MFRIMLPCLLSDKQQVEAKCRVLQLAAENGIPFGMEFYTRMSDLYDQSAQSAMVRNLALLPHETYRSMHAPYDQTLSGRDHNFFCSEIGFANFLQSLWLADLVDAKLINLHAHQFLSYPEMQAVFEEGIDVEHKRMIGRVVATLNRLHAVRPPRQILCIENSNYFLANGTPADPKDMLFELASAEPADIIRMADPQRNIFMTLDVCHLAKTVDSSQLLPHIISAGAYLRHVHFSDLRGCYIPFMQHIEEGVALGMGRIGEDIGKQIARTLLQMSEHQDISVVLEIWDRDLTEARESEASMRTFLEWIM